MPGPIGYHGYSGPPPSPGWPGWLGTIADWWNGVFDHGPWLAMFGAVLGWLLFMILSFLAVSVVTIALVAVGRAVLSDWILRNMGAVIFFFGVAWVVFRVKKKRRAG